MLISQRPLAMFEAEQSTSQDVLTPSTKSKSLVFGGIIEDRDASIQHP